MSLLWLASGRVEQLELQRARGWRDPNGYETHEDAREPASVRR
jgi:hypothetical protein